MEAFKLKYDITLPAYIVFILAYPPGIVSHLAGYEIIFPIPQTITLKNEMRGIKERVRVKEQLLTQLDVVSKEIVASERHIGLEPGVQHNLLSLKLLHVMRGSTIIDSIITSAEERDYIQQSLAKGLLDAKGGISRPSLQDVMGHFLNNLPKRINSIKLFMLYTKAGILLLRWLSSLESKPIMLSRTGRYSPYVVDFPAEDAGWSREYFYSNKVFFDSSEYDHAKSGVVADISYLELTPIYLNHEYLKEVRTIFEDVKVGKLDRQTYGFSAVDKTFEGEVLNLDESFAHYDYLVNKMAECGVECFYMYWFTDKRGRVYPSLTNFSIQSSRIIRLGFLFKPSARNLLTLGDIEHLPAYKDYIVNLVIKHVPSTPDSIDFDQAVEILKGFTISGSKKHYELLLRKLEINRLLTHNRAHISPISIDGRCNVYQHISALTRDDTLSTLVYTTPISSGTDIYAWFSNLLIREIESRSEDLDLMRVYREFCNKGVDMRGLVKQAIMTFPYGSTEYTIRKDMNEYLRENYGEIP